MADLEQAAIERLRTASEISLRSYGEPLVITYSGGKDSDVLLHLAEASGIPFEVLHNLTTADAPETVRHVYDTFRRLEAKGIKCTVDKHVQPDGSRVTMWNLIPRKLIPPTRMARYCCKELKEGGGKGRFIATGVRWAESIARRKNRGGLEVVTNNKKTSLILSGDNDESRRLFETCQLKGARVANPIIDWTDADVWNYALAEKITMNPLYCKGFRRVGCIGCPMAGGKIQAMEFSHYPKYKIAYIRAFDRMLEERRKRKKDKGPTRWGNTGVDVFHWWMEDGILPGQNVLEGFEVDKLLVLHAGPATAVLSAVYGYRRCAGGERVLERFETSGGGVQKRKERRCRRVDRLADGGAAGAGRYVEMSKWCFGKCDRCVWKYNGGCSEWRFWNA